jgi:hypothetical protein
MTLKIVAVFRLVYCSAYSSILKMEAIFSLEMSVDFHMVTRRYTLEHATLQSL